MNPFLPPCWILWSWVQSESGTFWTSLPPPKGFGNQKLNFSIAAHLVSSWKIRWRSAWRSWRYRGQKKKNLKKMIDITSIALLATLKDSWVKRLQLLERTEWNWEILSEGCRSTGTFYCSGNMYKRMASYQYTTEADCPRPIFSFTSGGLVQGSETRVDNQNNPAGFFG